METLTHPDGTITVQPIAAEYSLGAPLIPRVLDGLTPCWCEMAQHQLEAAKQDDRIYVLESLHSNKPIHPQVVTHLSAHGVKPEHTTHEMLEALCGSMGEPLYLPAE